MEHFGERLKRIRLKRGYSQRQAAHVCRITENYSPHGGEYFSQYELGRAVPNSRFLYKICKHLNVSADYLLGLKDKEEIE